MPLSYAEKFHSLVLYPSQLVPAISLLLHSQVAHFARRTVSYLGLLCRRENILLGMRVHLNPNFVFTDTDSLFINSTSYDHQLPQLFQLRLIEVDRLKFFNLDWLLIKSFTIIRLISLSMFSKLILDCLHYPLLSIQTNISTVILSFHLHRSFISLFTIRLSKRLLLQN